MAHRSGGKITSSHTTLIPVSDELVEFVEPLPEVTKIILGPIEQVGSRRDGTWVVKIIDEETCVSLRTTQNSTTQIVRVLTRARQRTKLAIARFVRNNGWQLRFGKLY